MAAERKFKTAAQLRGAWKRYKQYCDEHTVMQRTEEDGRERVIKLSRPLTYTIEGFCVYNHITRQAFYKTYSCREEFCDVVEQMRDECCVDARKKFETGQLPAKLASLWMSHYGYSSRPTLSDTDTEILRFEDL